MKYIKEFRDPEKAKAVLQEIEQLTQQLNATTENPIRLMEVCGGHTHTIFKFGLEELLPRGIDLIHVGFAMSRIDELEAKRTLELLTELGEMQDEWQEAQTSLKATG